MRQALHIFCKDIRRLRYDILVTLILAATFAWSTGQRTPVFDWQTDRLNRVAELLSLLLPLAWSYLVARAIYGEPLPGDCQFWVTKPYRWKSLLGAKVLFIVVFVILPLLLSDCAILALQGFYPLDHLAGIAWHPLVFVAVFLLPVAALACITVSIAQMVLAVLAVIAVLSVLLRLGITPSTPWFGSPEWVRVSLAFLVLLLGGLTIMVLQYHARRTGISRILASATLGLAMIVLGFLPLRVEFAMQSRLFKSRVDTSSISIQLQPVRRLSPGPPQQSGNGVLVALPIDFSGVPLGMLAVVDGIAAELELPDGKLSKPLLMQGNVTVTVDGKRRYPVSVERNLYAQVKNTPLRMHLLVLLTLYGNPRTERMPIKGNFHRVPGVGVCAAEALENRTRVGCSVPFRPPGRTKAQSENTIPVDSWAPYPLSPYPADFGISPMDHTEWSLPYQAGGRDIIFTTMQTLAHIRREIDIPNVQLADFAN